VKFTAQAERQVDDLRQHYRRLNRPEAGRNLTRAVFEAIRRIETDPTAGLPAPPPYPSLILCGRAWLKQGRYWFFYSVTEPPVMMGVFYDAADIPNRL
jgi:plasmid stabilization system protein ParE